MGRGFNSLLRHHKIKNLPENCTNLHRVIRGVRRYTDGMGDQNNYAFIDAQKVGRDGSGAPKGNVDVDLTLHAVDLKGEYDRAVIITSDGDFASLVAHLRERNKLLTVLSPEPNGTHQGCCGAQPAPRPSPPRPWPESH